VVPDVALPSLGDSSKIGERERDNALPWDTIHPVPHKRYAGFDDKIEILRQRHAMRQQSRSELIRLTERLALEAQWRDESAALVNLPARRAEKERRETALLEVENRHRLRTGKTPYEDVESWRAADEDADSALTGEADTDSPAQVEEAEDAGDTLVLVRVHGIRPSKWGELWSTSNLQPILDRNVMSLAQLFGGKFMQEDADIPNHTYALCFDEADSAVRFSMALQVALLYATWVRIV
jgi:hypothetical protein